jgi:anti-sigma factor RsiW
MSHPDDGQLHALVDGELTPVEAAELEAHLRTCDACRARLGEARALLGESDGIVARLDLEPRRAPKAARGRTGPDYRVLGLAASALLVVTVGFLVLRPRRDVAPTVTAIPSADSVARAAEPEAAAAAPVAEDHTALRRQEPAKSVESRDEAKAERAEPTVAGGQLANRAPAVVADTPPSRAAEGVALNDLPPWKPKVAVPATVPAAARFRLDGLDVVSSRPLPGGGIRLVYSVNGTPVEFDQVPKAAAGAQPAREAGVNELSWSRDDFRLTLRSALAVGELERLRQQVR